MVTNTSIRCLRGGPLYDRPPLDYVVCEEEAKVTPITLVGDALHPMTPFKGQGANSALIDVLSDAKARGEDIGNSAVLARYEQWRRFDTATLAIATDTFNRLFSNDNPLLRAVRDAGMGLVNAAPGLRRTFIREAAGLTGDLPSLMRS